VLIFRRYCNVYKDWRENIRSEDKKRNMKEKKESSISLKIFNGKG
jgi:hypothetical protein